METSPQKKFERIVSQRATQMSNSFSCKNWALGFICGVCITYLLLVASSPLRIVNSLNSSFVYSGIKRFGMYDGSPKHKIKIKGFLRSESLSDSEKILFLYSAWSSMLDKSKKLDEGFDDYNHLPKAPHLENCKAMVEINKHFDKSGVNGSFPSWLLWRALLVQKNVKQHTEKGQMDGKLEGTYPSWVGARADPGINKGVEGSDEDNFPYTRQVQKDIWTHQHPPNCHDSNLKFLIADWERLPGFGMGAQLAGMCGLLAIAINENRILVTNYYNRADHDGCQGPARSHWSCYFFQETSQECRDHAFDLMKSKEAWDNKRITVKENYTSKEIWTGRIPRKWGEPWSYLQPTTDIDGSLLLNHRKMDRRWWRAQAIRYLMRFQTSYTCHLLNVAKHTSFGMQAAAMVIKNLPAKWPQVGLNNSRSRDIEKFVWSRHKPWIPRPLLSMHVRMGDKSCEMKVVDFESYMQLADRIRNNFPNLHNIWLSTEMQEVVDKTRKYPRWNFYYTDVKRQVGNITMATYEASLGRETSTNYPLVNFLMATEADFFVGALGSTWCYLIDGMRNTGGKVMSGYLSVNKDRFW